MKTLQEIYNEHKVGDWPDKGSVHSYIEVYEEILAPYRKDTRNYILEIGLMGGESFLMWTDYFAGSVYGIDCDVKPINGKADLSKLIDEGWSIDIGDATNPKDIEKFYRGLTFDVIIEDANHDIDQQFEIYKTVFPYLNDGGIYIIEDIQDIDKHRVRFDWPQIEIIDRRHIKGRYDDVLVIIRK